jgi:hypothetical protein
MLDKGRIVCSGAVLEYKGWSGVLQREGGLFIGEDVLSLTDTGPNIGTRNLCRCRTSMSHVSLKYSSTFSGLQ